MSSSSVPWRRLQTRTSLTKVCWGPEPVTFVSDTSKFTEFVKVGERKRYTLGVPPTTTTGRGAGGSVETLRTGLGVTSEDDVRAGGGLVGRECRVVEMEVGRKRKKRPITKNINYSKGEGQEINVLRRQFKSLVGR